MKKSNTLVKKTCRIAKTVMKKTQELFELSQLNVKIMQVKNKIERKYVKIGYYLYNKQKEGGLEKLKDEISDEKFENVFVEIDELYKELEKFENELEEIKRCVSKKTNCKKQCKDHCSSNDENVFVVKKSNLKEEKDENLDIKREDSFREFYNE